MDSHKSEAAAARPARRCPYCYAPAPGRYCGACGRDTTARRRPCRKCGRMAMSSEPACWNCGAGHTGDMWWKVPLIVFLFLLAFALSALLGALR